MMNHPDSRRFSAFLEGDLAPPELHELEKHLAGCDVCSAMLQDLQEIQGQARELPDRFPSRDLWPGIAQVIKEEAGGDPDVVRLHSGVPVLRQPRRRGLHFSVPQAVAAGLAIAIFSGLVGARLGHEASSQTVAFQDGISLEMRSSWVSLVGEAKPALEAKALEVARLEQLLAEHQGELDPHTVQLLEKSLDIIDGAIRESVSALRTDPGNRFLEDNLERAILAKGEYLRDAALLVSPMT